MSNIDKRALREAANAANAASWGDWESYKPHKGARGYEVKVGVKAVAQHCLKVDSVFIAAANPATVLALLNEIAELEQRHCGTALLEREEMHTKALGRMLDELEESERLRFKFQEANCELCQKLEAAEKRIAELEAREVVLPSTQDVHPLGPQSAKIFCEFHRSIVNRCADEIRKVGVKVSIKGN